MSDDPTTPAAEGAKTKGSNREESTASGASALCDGNFQFYFVKLLVLTIWMVYLAPLVMKMFDKKQGNLIQKFRSFLQFFNLDTKAVLKEVL